MLYRREGRVKLAITAILFPGFVNLATAFAGYSSPSPFALLTEKVSCVAQCSWCLLTLENKINIKQDNWSLVSYVAIALY